MSVVKNWKRELDKWLPDLRCVILPATEFEREEVVANVIKPRNFDIIITSYEGCVKNMKNLQKFDWEYLVIDEAHRIKNENSNLAKQASRLYKRRTLLLTGTPLQNDLHELWALLNFLMPELFNDPELFDKIFEEQDENGEEMTKMQILENKKKLIRQIHAILRPFMLRRVKSDCLDIQLPPKKEIYLYVNFTELQKEVYKNLILWKKASLTDTRQLSNVLMHLRKAAIHPYLFEGIEDKEQVEFGEHLIENSGKMKMLDRLLKKLFAGNHRCLIFSQFKRVLDIIEDYCNYRGWKYCRLDGDYDLDAKDDQVMEFTKKDENGEFCTEKF